MSPLLLVLLFIFSCEEAPAFDLKFIYPVEGATDTTIFSSTISHAVFMQTMADNMDIRKADLKIGYKLSFSKRADLPRILRTPQHLQELFASARGELIARVKNKSRKKDAVEVTIVDRTPKAPKEMPAKKTGKPVKRKQKSGTDDEEDEEEKPKTAAEWMIELEEARQCEKHQAHCQAF
ncbi:hypothetical protein R3P38DRAFT_2777199 [Favolaschia claudopus]|uniref:Uncharacterized protein n=1 Tax=Favolaschia claudopus TaxID=2862362 RepID=A0AAW0BMA9_9AGAR